MMDANGSDMLNNGNFALFWTIEGIVSPRGGKIKNWRFGSYGHFGDKNAVFTCLLSNEGCDIFPKHLDSALAPNNTNERVKKQ